MIVMMPSVVSTSMKIVSVPAENASLIASTSVVKRVTKRPTGLRSKEAGRQFLEVGKQVTP